MKNCTVPVIFFHGECDDCVPCEMSRINYGACTGKKMLITIPGAGHGLSYPAGIWVMQENVPASRKPPLPKNGNGGAPSADLIGVDGLLFLVKFTTPDTSLRQQLHDAKHHFTCL